MNTKPWYQSKTVWLGIVMTLSGIIPTIVDLLNKTTITSAEIVSSVGGILVVILRIWFTDTAIA